MASEKLSTLISALSAKSPPVDADKVPILDSANSFNFIYSTWAVFKSTLKTYFDGLYSVSAHAHGNITTAGAIGSTTNLPLITTTSGVVTVGAFGTGATDFCVGNDARLATIGKQVIYVPAGAIIPSATGGCDSIAVIATSANHPDLTVLDFDATTAEYAQFSIGMPNQWDEGTITYQVYWTVTAAVTTGVAWQLQAVAVSNDDTIDAAYGTAVTVTDTALNASNDQHITAVSTAVTIAGTPAAGDIVYFRINRNPADAGDDMTQDARLIGVKVYWTQAVGVEA